ncbi:SDR family NAD(P)-dependent oxidoreductase [Gemmobacter sp.]|uniref:SDR family NAD(P)-dependent oxidoreductase n=1 Tax=Gemmobacter sp. TaxID=1898957 RepID=UPI002AFF3941|nr:SDR family oxidoreductase [Gemmobacter sp.]
MPDLKDHNIIITGAGRGIGAAIARGLAQDGARITVADLSGETAEATAAAIRDAGGQAIAVKVDVTDRAQVRAMIAASVAAHGPLASIFNNAGIVQVKPFLTITEDDWRVMHDVNGLGVLIAMQEVIETFQKQGKGGSIINTASIGGKLGTEPLAHYCASKFGVVALTQAAARTFGRDGIRVNAICPGNVATDMWKKIDEGFRETGLTSRENEAFEKFASTAALGRPSYAEDLVGISRFLASSDSGFVTGQSIVVDGGTIFS